MPAQLALPSRQAQPASEASTALATDAVRERFPSPVGFSLRMRQGICRIVWGRRYKEESDRWHHR